MSGADAEIGRSRARADHLPDYARAYGGMPRNRDIFQMWFDAYSDARQIESKPGEIYRKYGLSALQMGEGARRKARQFAIMLALQPAETVADLGFKLFVRMSVERDLDEIGRSHIAEIMEASTFADQRLTGLSVAPITFDLH